MSEATVEQIIEMIDALPEEERESLEHRLAQRNELEWRKEADAARLQAKERGIDQAAIDTAVQRHRYGS
ncbi:MAG: hypothetical protein ACE5KM_09460 [Planctomycetaceae bacterium]